MGEKREEKKGEKERGYIGMEEIKRYEKRRKGKGGKRRWVREGGAREME